MAQGFGGQLGRVGLGRFELGAIPEFGTQASFSLIVTAGVNFAGKTHGFGSFDATWISTLDFAGNRAVFGALSPSFAFGSSFTGLRINAGQFTLNTTAQLQYIGSHVAFGAFTLPTTYTPTFLGIFTGLDADTIISQAIITAEEFRLTPARLIMVNSKTDLVLSGGELTVTREAS